MYSSFPLPKQGEPKRLHFIANDTTSFLYNYSFKVQVQGFYISSFESALSS
jgi:hypothetical protein